MSKKKPKKKLVSKGQYGVAKAVAFFLSGGVLLCVVLFAIAMMKVYREWDVYSQMQAEIAKGVSFDGWNPGAWDIIAGCLATIPPITIVGYLFLRGGRKQFTALRAMEPVTAQNAHLLPLQVTLVRASDLPPTEQPSELLRASQTGQETPKEELLRVVAADE